MGAHKKLLPLLIILLFAGTSSAFAGPATLTGVARCHMPDLLEMEASPHTTQAPEVTTSAGPVEIQKEDLKQGKDQDMMVTHSTSDTEQNITVYTICAK